MLSRFRRTDDGSIAVLAAVTFPVVLLCVALAVATMVWSSSEHETQRAADTAAVRAAATAFLGTDFPYAELPGSVTYPDVVSIAAAYGVAVPPALAACETVGVPPLPSTGLTLPGVDLGALLDLPVDCGGVGPFPVPPALGLPDQSRTVACSTAREAMAPDRATFGNRFYAGTGDSQPACGDRITVRVATGNPLVGFGQYATDTATGALDTTFAPQVATLRTVLAAYGVRLDTSLPSLICPEVAVAVDQPVREPVFDRSSVPNGRATARRVVKNAVVVPVFEGRTISAAADGAVYAAAGGAGVTTTTAAGGTVTIPPRNLNTLLIDAQAQLLTLLDEVDAIVDAAVTAAGITVDQLNGVFAGIDPNEPQPAVLPGAEPLRSLRLTKCLRDSMAQIFDPPAGDAPTADEVLASAAENGEQVLVVQVGAVEAACTEPGAIPYAPDVPETTPTPDCIRAATAPRLDPLTGIYEVPFFDVTPVLVQDVGDANYAAVPVHATQAAGAFRASLVRAVDDERWDPDVRQPRPTAACDVTVPLATPSTACAILDVTAPPVPTATPTLPIATPTLPSSPSPTLPLPSPTLPLPSPTCLLLCGGTR